MLRANSRFAPADPPAGTPAATGMRLARLLRITLDPMLDTALLDEFERILVTRGGLTAEHLRPGASESQLDAVADELSTPLPDEARLWWSWHDGADPPRPSAAAAMLGPGRPFLPLARAITDSQQAREIMSWDPNDLIHQCIVIDGGSEPAVAEIAGPATAPCPVWNLCFEYPTQASAGLTSLEALVRGWVEAYETGAWAWNDRGGTWGVS